MSKKIYITEEQETFLKENKGLLFEYYIQVSNPKKDTNILGNIQVWIYGDDRKDFTPHCHVMTSDKSTEIEVSIIDWKLVNIKRQNINLRKLQKPFLVWLNQTSSSFAPYTNKEVMYRQWDATNGNNTLSQYAEEHKLKIADKDLQQYLTETK